MLNIMIVDDEKFILKALQRTLSSLSYGNEMATIHTFECAEEALEVLEYIEFQIVISDYHMPKMDGVDFLKQVKEYYPNAARIVLSGNSNTEGLMRAINEAEIYRFITKPWNDADLLTTLLKTLEHRDALLQNQVLNQQVQSQMMTIKVQQLELERLERETPGITRVDRDEDGRIILEDSDDLSLGKVDLN